LFIYLIFLIFTAVLCGSISFYCIYRESIRGSKYFAVVAFSICVWIIFYILELISEAPEIKLFWFKIKYFGVVLLPPAFLLFSLKFINKLKKVHPLIFALLLIEPIISIFLIFTNEYHNLFFTNIAFALDALITPGYWFWAHAIISYVEILLSLFLIIFYASKTINYYRIQTKFIVVGALIPVCVNVVNLILCFYPDLRRQYIPVNPTIPSFAIFAVIIFFCIYKHNIFNLSPIARDIIFEKIDDGVLVIDKNGIIVDCNDSATLIVDRDINSLIGTLAEEHFYLWPDIVDKIKSRDYQREEVKLVIGNEIEYFDITFYPMYSNKKYYLGKVMVGRNITNRKNIENKYKFLSVHDSLTGLYNRTYYEEEIRRLEHSRNFPVSVLMIDLDNLKTVNDTKGHQQGDVLLIKLAEFLKLVFRSEDMIARIGGDEFIIVLPKTNQAVVDIIQDRIEKEIVKFNLNCDINLSFSLGVKTQIEKGDLAKTIKEADDLMYKNKIERKEKKGV